MALLSQLKRRFGRGSSPDDETGLRGNDILSEMARDRGSPPAQADKGLEEKAKRSLENFYTPETIDVGSVRPLSGSEILPPPVKQAAHPPPQMKNVNWNSKWGIGFSSCRHSARLCILERSQMISGIASSMVILSPGSCTGRGLSLLRKLKKGWKGQAWISVWSFLKSLPNRCI